MLGELIVNVEHRAAGVPEDVFDVFASQRFKQYPRSTHFHKFTSNNFRGAIARGTTSKNKNPGGLFGSPGFGISCLTFFSGYPIDEPRRNNRYRDNNAYYNDTALIL
jgi:hypothetical protein